MDIKKKMFMHVLLLMLFTDFTLKICRGYTEMVIGGLFYHLFQYSHATPPNPYFCEPFVTV